MKFPQILSLAVLAFSRMIGVSGTLLSYDFNQASPWPELSAISPDSQAQIKASAGAFGTISLAGTETRSGAVVLKVESCSADVSLKSGLISLKNPELELGKITLSFDLSVSVNQPVVIQVESFDADKKRTGGLQKLVFPAASNFFQRSAIELSAMKPFGEGAFHPDAPSVQFTWKLEQPAANSELRVDNVAYATPAFYVSGQGDDASDGRSEKTAFASPQKAVEAAQPGDITVLMEGAYDRLSGQPAGEPVVNFVRPGEPAAWITLKNYPGQQPVISASGQQAINLNHGKTPEEFNLAYIEIRGLRVRGNGDTAREKFPDEIGQSTPNTDSRGINIFGRNKEGTLLVHHIRLADNIVEYCTADGIYVDSADWVSIKNNRVLNNCWTTVGYAPAGLTVMKYANFDASENVFKFLVAGNQVSGNRLQVKNSPWGKEPKTSFFNGNGILIDDNGEHPAPDYKGRTLVQNNVVFDNGAGGIQCWGNHRLDIVNNTIYLNGTVLKWGQVGLERCHDVRLVNNIIVGQSDGPLDQWFASKPDHGTENIQRLNNLFFGGVNPPVPGTNDLFADPRFAQNAAEGAALDFHLEAGSPAVASGLWDSFIPTGDVEGRRRSPDRPPDRGAYQN